MRYVILAPVALLAVAIGVAAVVYGEADDSPGLQLLGALLVIATIGFGVRMMRRDGRQ
ncbi:MULTISPECIES: hypothetical protein [Micromonospora]|uniref:hypothetical protein n=1 Tax=Micromonospora TaxID=1873 RepID=UPI001651F234|nr:hypothetical protein [Micromonospora sp. WP24]